MTKDDEEAMRLLLSAVAMHALLSTMRPQADGVLNYNGNAVSEAAVKQADQLLVELRK